MKPATMFGLTLVLSAGIGALSMSAMAAPKKLDPGQVSCRCACRANGTYTPIEQVIEGRLSDCGKLNGSACDQRDGAEGEAVNCRGLVGSGGVVAPKVSDRGVDPTGGERPRPPARVSPADTGVGTTAPATRDPG